MKVLLISEYFWPFIGGAEISSLTIFSELAQMGTQVSVLTHSLPNTAAYESYKSLQIYREKFFLKKNPTALGRVVSYVFAAVLIIKWLRKEKPDVIFTQQLISIPTTLVAKIFRIPTIIMIRDYWPVCYYRTLLRPEGSICFTYDKCFKEMLACSRKSLEHHFKKSKFVFSLATFSYPFLMAARTLIVKRIIKKTNILAISFFLKNILEKNGFDPKKVSVVYNPVALNVQNFGSHQTRPFSILFVGTLDHTKGVQNLIKAMPQVCSAVRDAKLHIIGDGPQRAYLEILAKNLGVGNKCEFYGQLPEDQKIDLYESCKVVVMPSIWPEPFGRVVAEAISLKKPVVASNVGGLPELVNEKIGILVKPEDVPALADAIISILLDKRSFTLESAHERFSPREVARQYLDIIKKVCIM